MRVTQIGGVAALVLAYLTCGSSTAVAQAPLRARIVVFAHDDSASVALAQVIHQQLKQARDVELLGNVLTSIDRSVSTRPGEWTIEQKRAKARELQASAFVDIDATRVADISRVTAALGFTEPFIVDVVQEQKQGPLEVVAQSVVQRLGRRGWRSDRL